MTLSMVNRLLRAVPASIHGGVDARDLTRLGIDLASLIDFSANQSPLGPSPLVAEAVARAVVECYPDRDALPLAEAIAAHHGLCPAQVVVGNGSTELIRLIAQLALRRGERALAPAHTFGEYQVAVALAGAEYCTVQADNPFSYDMVTLTQAIARVQPRVCWWCLPNNPTGAVASPAEIAVLVGAHPDVLFVLDEAYCDLLPIALWQPWLLKGGNLLILRSMTKAMGLAGLRLGYVLGCENLIGILRAAKAPWNVNACAQEAGVAALSDSEHYAKTVALLREQKQALVDGLTQRGWQVLPSAAAFFLLFAGDGAGLKRQLLAHGCLVRDCASFGLPQYVRISPRHAEQNRRLLAAFDTLTPTRARGEKA